MCISNRTHGSENDTWYLSETIGVVYIAMEKLLKFITLDMLNEILEKSQLNGWYQFAELVMMPDTTNKSPSASRGHGNPTC